MRTIHTEHTILHHPLTRILHVSNASHGTANGIQESRGPPSRCFFVVCVCVPTARPWCGGGYVVILVGWDVCRLGVPVGPCWGFRCLFFGAPFCVGVCDTHRDAHFTTSSKRVVVWVFGVCCCRFARRWRLSIQMRYARARADTGGQACRSLSRWRSQG